MVYLVRTTEVSGDWERAWDLAQKLTDKFKEYKEVKDVKMLSNITGPISQMHWQIQFESLAEEEQFALKIVEDEGYSELMMATSDCYTVPSDELFRVILQ